MSKPHKAREAMKQALRDVPREGKPAVIYDPPLRGFFTVWDGQKSRAYGVQVDGEMNGAWCISHRRPSGRQDRQQRAKHIGAADAHRSSS